MLGLPWWSNGYDLPSNAGGVGWIPHQGAKTLHASLHCPLKRKNINKRSNILTNSVKTFKMVHMQKNLLKKSRPCISMNSFHILTQVIPIIPL